MCVRVYVYVCVCVYSCTCVFYFFFLLFYIPSRGGKRRRGGREKKKKLDDSAVPEKSFLSTPENRAEQLPRSAQDTLLLQFLGLRLVVGKTLRLPGRALLHFGG